MRKQKNGTNGTNGHTIDSATINAVLSAAAKPKTEEVKIPAIGIKVVELPVRGLSPLLVHAFDHKSRKQMEDKQQGAARHKKAAREPVADFLGGLYVIKGTPKAVTKKDGTVVATGATFGIPAAAFKNAAVSACRYVEGVPMTFARGAFHIVGGLLEIHGSDPVMDTATVRIGKGLSKVASIAYRPRFDQWAVKLTIRYNSSVINPSQIANLLNVAGFAVGVCDWRPEKSGSFGMFTVGSNDDN